MTEAKEAVSSLINKRNAMKWAVTTDQMIWVESNIMAPAGIQSSINTDFGEALCDWIEDELDSLIA